MIEYTSAEVAAQLHVSQEWIWQCVRDGRLAARRIGGKRMLLIAEADLIAFAIRYNKPLPPMISSTIPEKQGKAT